VETTPHFNEGMTQAEVVQRFSYFSNAMTWRNFREIFSTVGTSLKCPRHPASLLPLRTTTMSLPFLVAPFLFDPHPFFFVDFIVDYNLPVSDLVPHTYSLN
jgi:hypothetical protein